MVSLGSSIHIQTQPKEAGTRTDHHEPKRWKHGRRTRASPSHVDTMIPHDLGHKLWPCAVWGPTVKPWTGCMQDPTWSLHCVRLSSPLIPPLLFVWFSSFPCYFVKIRKEENKGKLKNLRILILWVRDPNRWVGLGFDPPPSYLSWSTLRMIHRSQGPNFLRVKANLYQALIHGGLIQGVSIPSFVVPHLFSLLLHFFPLILSILSCIFRSEILCCQCLQPITTASAQPSKTYRPRKLSLNTLNVLIVYVECYVWKLSLDYWGHSRIR